MFKNQAQIFYNSELIGYNTNLNVETGLPNYENMKAFGFSSDDAEEYWLMTYDSDKDLYKTMDQSVWSDFYIDIHATSATTGSLTDNDCVCVNIGKDASAKQIYRIYCTVGTAAVRKAQVLKTLFYGTNGSDPGIVDHVSGCVKIDSSDADDLGKQVHYSTISFNSGGTGQLHDAYYTGTYVDTSTNLGCQTWSYCTGSGTATAVGNAEWENPTGTSNNVVADATTDETGTDTTGDDTDNPSTCKLHTWSSGDGNYPSSAVVRTIILCKGDITWVETDPDSKATVSNTGFLTDESIPVFTAAETSTDSYLIAQVEDSASTTITNCIGTYNSSIDASNSIAMTISVDGGSNYESATDATILRPTNTGTDFKIKLTITRTDDTTIDKISELAGIYNLY